MRWALAIGWPLLGALLVIGCGPTAVPERQRAQAGRRADPLSEASRARTALRGTLGAERERMRERAVREYRLVACDRGCAPELRAEAAFRAGELLRAGGRPERAAAEFEAAEALAPHCSFGARAVLELGHLHRRAGRRTEALAAYERLVTDPRAGQRPRDRAGWWAGRVEAERDRPVEARQNWERVARRGEDPILRLRAFDAWIGSLVSSGCLEEAAGTLDLCRTELVPRSEEVTELGRRLRKEFERMRAPALLSRSVADRSGRADPP